MRKSAVSAAIAVVLAFAATEARAADTIRILTPTWLGFAPVLVAKDLGYFAKLVRLPSLRGHIQAPSGVCP